MFVYVVVQALVFGALTCTLLAMHGWYRAIKEIIQGDS